MARGPEPGGWSPVFAGTLRKERPNKEDMNTMKATKMIGMSLAMAALSMAMGAGPGTAKLEGKGIFKADGRGIATVSGNGKFVVEGKGDLLVIADSNDRIEISGFGLERVVGNKHYYRGSGKVTVTGSDISVKLDGAIDNLACAGNGSARLLGRGDYAVGKLVGTWSSQNNTIWFIEAK